MLAENKEKYSKIEQQFAEECTYEGAVQRGMDKMWGKIVIELLNKGLTPSYVAKLLNADLMDILELYRVYNQGIQAGKLETARNLLKKDVDINRIIAITNLTKEEVEHASELLQEIQEEYGFC